MGCHGFRRQENGLNRIFDWHADKFIVHDEKVAAVRKADEKPDRVFGLRRTVKVAEILKQSTESAQPIEETLRTSPFQEEAAALIFPFLIVEANSEKSDSVYPEPSCRLSARRPC